MLIKHEVYICLENHEVVGILFEKKYVFYTAATINVGDTLVIEGNKHFSVRTRRFVIFDGAQRIELYCTHKSFDSRDPHNENKIQVPESKHTSSIEGIPTSPIFKI